MRETKVGRVKKQCDIRGTVKPGRHRKNERTNEKANEQPTEAQRGRDCYDCPLNNRFFILGCILLLTSSFSLLFLTSTITLFTNSETM